MTTPPAPPGPRRTAASDSRHPRARSSRIARSRSHPDRLPARGLPGCHPADHGGRPALPAHFGKYEIRQYPPTIRSLPLLRFYGDHGVLRLYSKYSSS